MICLHGNTVFSDVDDTLVLHAFDPSDEVNAIDIIFDTTGTTAERAFGQRKHKFHVVVHVEHVNFLRRCKAAGMKVVVWSRGGSEWAECVVRWLKLQPAAEGGDGTVDLVLSKPDQYLDDLDANQFMKQGYIDHVAPNRSRIGLGPHGVGLKPPRKIIPPGGGQQDA